MVDKASNYLDINKLLFKKYIKENKLNTYGLEDFIQYKPLEEVIKLFNFIKGLNNKDKIIYMETLNHTVRIFYMDYHENRRAMKMELFKYIDGEWQSENNYIWDYRREDD